MKLNAKVILEYQEKVKRITLTTSEFEAISRELRDKYNLTDREVIDILNDRNVLKILAKKEKELEL
jgi:predicted phosphoribosyltransferase